MSRMSRTASASGVPTPTAVISLVSARLIQAQPAVNLADGQGGRC